MAKIIKFYFILAMLSNGSIFNCNSFKQKTVVEDNLKEKKCTLEDYAFLYFIVDQDSNLKMTRAEVALYDGDEYISKNFVMKNKILFKISRRKKDLNFTVYGMDDNSFSSWRDFSSYNNENEENPRNIKMSMNWKREPGQLSFIIIKSDDTLIQEMHDDYLYKLIKRFGFKRYGISVDLNKGSKYANDNFMELIYNIQTIKNEKFLTLLGDNAGTSKGDYLYLLKDNKVLAELKITEVIKNKIHFEIICGEVNSDENDLFIIKK